MADISDDLNTITEAYEALLMANKDTLGLEDVFYGDQVLIPRVPAACVIAGHKKREWRTAPRGMFNTFRVDILVYHYQVQESMSSESARQATKTAEALEDLIHRVENKSLGGLVVHQYVTDVDPRFASRGGNQFKVTQLTMEAINQTQLPT
jgi:hypothetical protein